MNVPADHADPGWLTRQWPWRRLVLRTPRLVLCPDDDEGLLELAAEARRGVHPPERMPFLVPWTDADPEVLGRNVLQHFWSERAAFSPAHWALNFLVRLDGRVIGVQSLIGAAFAVTREVQTGSWIGMRHQGNGIGTEMRAAVLMYAFDWLSASQARSGALSDNLASLRVSAKLGYVPDGTARLAVRDRAVEEVRLLVTPRTFRRPGWELAVEGHTPL